MTLYWKSNLCVRIGHVSLVCPLISWMFTNRIATNKDGSSRAASADEHWTRTFSSSSGSYLVTLLKHLTSDRTWSWLNAHGENQVLVLWIGVVHGVGDSSRWLSPITLISPANEFAGTPWHLLNFLSCFALTNTLSCFPLCQMSSITIAVSYGSWIKIRYTLQMEELVNKLALIHGAWLVLQRVFVCCNIFFSKLCCNIYLWKLKYMSGILSEVKELNKSQLNCSRLHSASSIA